MRRAGRFPTPRLAGKGPRMSRAGSFQTRMLAAKEPRGRPVTGLTIVPETTGAPVDTSGGG